MKLENKILVRDDLGFIGKIKSNKLVDDIIYFTCDNEYVNLEHITKASFNLIDLIEETDIIQLNNNMKYEVGATTFFNDDNIMELCVFDWNGRRTLLKRFIEENKVKSILTHEKYEANCYKVVE